ncbi:MAG: ClpXP protease specificity-enhancing factor [Pseudomonadota bacterium]
MPALPKRPYFLRALYDWIVDSGLTPYLLVSADSDDVRVPEEYVSEGKIVLNVSPDAIRDLVLGDESVSFSGRFSGRPFPIAIPLASVQAIYAKETGEGMMFEPEYEDAAGDDATGDGRPDDEPPSDPSPPEKAPPGGSHLKVIK